MGHTKRHLLFKRAFSGLLCFIIATAITVGSTTSTSALSDYLRTIFKENNLIFWNPDEKDSTPCQPTYTEDSSSGSSSSSSRLKWAVKTYGEVAMEMQREYGVPWEVVFAQMQHESAVGTAGIAVNGATNNWLGITGEGDAGFIQPASRKWAVFSSVEASIKAWAGKKVLRNGVYDDALSVLLPNDYDLHTFLVKMIHHYAPNSDGNNEANYVSSVESLINGSIKEAREEKGWPSSAELAKRENIQPGGRNPLGSSSIISLITSLTDIATTTICDNDKRIDSSDYGQRIADKAIELAWPENGHEDEIYPAFANAARGLGENPTLNWSADCGHFVSTVVRSSGVDTGFPAGGTSFMKSYLQNSSKWQSVENLGNTSNLQPGDVFIVTANSSSRYGHIFIYTGSVDGKNGASASINSYTGKRINVYYRDKRGTYQIYRYKG